MLKNYDKTFLNFEICRYDLSKVDLDFLSNKFIEVWKIRKFKNKKICIVSNDAGGAEILKSLTNSFKGNFKFLLKGPALNIFQKNFFFQHL